jgi:hypothetical protein
MTTATFTRASVAYKQDGSQVLSGVPRYEAGRFGQAITVEEGTVNLCKYSQELDNALWVKAIAGTGVLPVVTINDALAPDGTMTADKVVFNRGAGNTVNDQSRIYQTLSDVTAGATYCLSLWIKGAAGQQIVARSVQGGYILAHTCTGVWERINVIEVASSTTGSLEFANRGTFTTDNTSTVWVWGVQLEQKGYATSYMPTTSAAATRQPEILTIPFPEAIHRTEGTACFWFKAPEYNLTAYLDIVQADWGWLLRKEPGSLTSYVFSMRKAANFISIGIQIPGDTYTHIAATWKDGGAASVYVNGVQVLNDPSYVKGDVIFNNIVVGGDLRGTAYIDDLRTFSTAKTQDEIIAIYTGEVA